MVSISISTPPVDVDPGTRARARAQAVSAASRSRRVRRDGGVLHSRRAVDLENAAAGTAPAGPGAGAASAAVAGDVAGDRGVGHGQLAVVEEAGAAAAGTAHAAGSAGPAGAAVGTWALAQKRAPGRPGAAASTYPGKLLAASPGSLTLPLGLAGATCAVAMLRAIASPGKTPNCPQRSLPARGITKREPISGARLLHSVRIGVTARVQGASRNRG